MHDDKILEAAERAAIDGAPAKFWWVSPDADVEFGTDPYNPFDGATFTAWELPVATGRNE